MKIIVICENPTQFRDYVRVMLEKVASITQTVVFGTHVKVEELEFIYCNDPYRLRGMIFGENDRIEKVGSWYNIPEETREEIVTYFMARIR